MNITISLDGSAVVLRIEPPADGIPVRIMGITAENSLTPSPPETQPPGRSWLQSRPVRLLALAGVLFAFIQVGMVISGSSRSALEPRVAQAKAAQIPAKVTKTRDAVPPEVAIADALAGQPQLIGSTGAPKIAPGSAQAQSRFGLDP